MQQIEYTNIMERTQDKDLKEIVQNRRLYCMIKRIMDVVLSTVGIALLSPMYIITMLLIICESRGSVIFKQNRVGKDGNIFLMYKFRSMCVGAEKQRDSLLNQNVMDGPVFKITDDPRVTKIGKFIRKYSIDELPQLWNVLVGDMSLVGPRPLVIQEAHACNEYAKQRELVKPGLTCYWQIGGRNDIQFDEWIELDLKYIREQSIWVDIKILFKTVYVVVLGKGAY